MKQTINLYRFRRGFEELRPNNFSYDGLEVLFDYFEALEDEIFEQIEYDVIAICCDYSESTLQELNRDYEQDFESLEQASEWLQDETILVGTTEETVIFQDF